MWQFHSWYVTSVKLPQHGNQSDTAKWPLGFLYNRSRWRYEWHQSGLRRRHFNFKANFSISDDKILYYQTLRWGLYKRRFFRISLTDCFNFAIYTHRREYEIKRPSLVARAKIWNPDLKWICTRLNILGLSQWCVYTPANPSIYTLSLIYPQTFVNLEKCRL